MSWLEGWDNRIRLIIDSSKIEEDLTDFPVLIALSFSSGQTGHDATGVFDELATTAGSYSNRKKIAVTTVISGVETKLFTEIEYWGDYDKQAWLWTKVPTIASGTDTELYFYYDKDQADQDERTLAEANDTFTGNNGDLPNQELWRIRSGTPTIQGNRLRLQTVSGSVKDRVCARYEINGDFDIQVDYDYPSPPGLSASYPCLLVILSSTYRLSFGLYDYPADRKYYKEQVIGGTSTNFFSGTTTDTSGKFRITRTGSNWHGYYWNGSAWVEVGSASVVGSGPITAIDLFANSWGGYPVYTCYFDNFTINPAGSVTGFVDDTLGRPAQEVWDDNFKLVCHMDEDPSGGSNCIKDSTRNANHGTPAGSMTTADLVDSKIGKGIDFDGVNDLIDTTASVVQDGTATIEMGVKLIQQASVKGDYIHITDNFFIHSANNYVYAYAGADYFPIAITTSWQYLAITYHGDTSTGKLCRNGTFYNQIQQPASHTNNAWDGCISDTGLGANTAMYGTVDEVRQSDVVRSEAWQKATYHSNWDNLITYQLPSYFSGYVYEQGSPVARTLYLHNRSDGSLADTTTSSGNGYYYLGTTFSGSHYIVCLDDSAGEDYNDLIIGDIYPTGVV